ncbi:MAG: asparagine synthase (glutamine-hydrolyzing) [Acidobacteria bacterium]|nr:asparagine synthase (glutamine-hydrolyzing) [Acidobacteriota bacterium]
MCGICGFAGFDDAGLLRRMMASLTHRGPDSEGFFSGPEASLGFRRLSIIDLVTGEQPVANEDGTVRVVLNGEVYNFGELRQQLERRGHRFSTSGDAEVIVHLYEDEGEALLARLQGMFAFALWDAKRKRLLLARDRLGIKPLYFVRAGERFLFASEAKALLQDPELPRRLNPRAVDRLLRYLYLPGPETLLEGVLRLPPGGWLVWQNGDIRRGRYWEPHLEQPRPVSEDEAVAEFRRRFEEAVRSHLVSDVPVGALLSGGLDSAGVAAQMTRLLGRPFKTFTVGFAGADDERPIARRLAEHFGTEHQEFELRPEHFLEDLPRILWHLEEPTPISFLPLFYLARFVRPHVKVALIGEGADELFGGYRRLLPFSPALRFLPLGLQRRLYQFGLHSLGGADGARSAQAAAAHLAGDPLQSAFEAAGPTPLARILNFEQRYPLPDYQLHRVDRMTMAWGLEARVPYLDHRLVEYANSLPDGLKMRRFERKYLLRRALAGLVPAEVLEGKKRGFGAPFRLWYSADFREAARRYLDEGHMRERSWFRREWARTLFRPGWGWWERRRGSQLFLLLTLEIYCRLFVDPAAHDFPVVPPPTTARALTTATEVRT